MLDPRRLIPDRVMIDGALAGDVRPLPERLDLGRGPTADDVEMHIRKDSADMWQDLVGEPGHGVYVGVVVHSASEDHRVGLATRRRAQRTGC